MEVRVIVHRIMARRRETTTEETRHSTAKATPISTARIAIVRSITARRVDSQAVAEEDTPEAPTEATRAEGKKDKHKVV